MLCLIKGCGVVTTPPTLSFPFGNSEYICKKRGWGPLLFAFDLSCAGTALFSQAVTRQVSSALMSLTSVFGMGTGGTSSPLAPANFNL